MEAISLIISKFSTEIIQVQLAVLSLFGSVALYWFLIKRRERQNSEWVPAAIVKEYLDRMAEDERQTRYRLFGGYAPYAQGTPLPMQPMQMASAMPVTATVSAGSVDPGLLREVEALRAQLANADKRTSEFDRTLNQLKEEKALAEQKLKDLENSKAAGAAPTGGVDPAVMKELDDLRARLKEYEIIEDDLANLKKYQAENKELKEKLAAGGGGATVTPIAAATATAPAPVAEAAPAAPAAAAATPAPAPAATATPAAAAPVEGQKKEAELLSEFEKMLAS